MSLFVQSLENRKLLSTTLNVAGDGANIVSDLKSIVADAKSAKLTLTTDAQAVITDLKSAHLQHDPLVAQLHKNITGQKRILTADVKKIITSGSNTAQAVVTDWLNITIFHASNPTQVAKDQTKLAADLAKLRDIETPLFARLQGDITAAETQVETTVQAIADKHPEDAALQADWSALQGAIQTSQQSLTTDFGKLAIDVNTLIADA